jgi:hypothetical protein
MHPQLREIEQELVAAREGFRRLAERMDGALARTRPAPGAWSAAECVEHLNLTSAAMLPELRAGIEEARALGGAAPGRLRRGLVGWLIWRASRPGGGMRVRTRGGFVPPEPAGHGTADGLLDAFDRHQEEQIALVRSADGLPLHRVRVRSVFDRRVSYNLYAGLAILSTHQLRHLGQAERAVEAVRWRA